MTDKDEWLAQQPDPRVADDPGRIQLAYECAAAQQTGHRILFRAAEDLVIGLPACSAPDLNNGVFKPSDYAVS